MSSTNDDNVELAGIRQDGRRVTVAGMSDGTVDQLYLALRVAAIEDYLDHAEPMPFIADDLFINFDDKRAAAGFRVLKRTREEDPSPVLHAPPASCWTWRGRCLALPFPRSRSRQSRPAWRLIPSGRRRREAAGPGLVPLKFSYVILPLCLSIDIK